MFSEQGAMLGILKLATSDIFGIVILDNYVIFVSADTAQTESVGSIQTSDDEFTLSDILF